MSIDFNFVGVSAALAAFLGIWLGHISVRVIEYNAKELRAPISIALALGLAFEIGSLLTLRKPLSAALGILGMTILWDALEFVRQEKRVKKGHAPANSVNPRHAKILLEYPSATTLDLLKRDPVGHPIAPIEQKENA